MPSPPPHEFLQLLQQAQGGSDEAAKRLYETYRKPLLLVIRRKLAKRLRTVFDSDDFVQEAFAELFAREFAAADLSTPQSFLTYVQKIAENKVNDAARKYLATERHGITGEISREKANAQAIAEETAEGFWHGGATAKALLRRACADMPAVQRAIVEHWLDGHKPAVIASSLALEVGFVYRCIENSKRHFNRCVDAKP